MHRSRAVRAIFGGAKVIFGGAKVIFGGAKVVFGGVKVVFGGAKVVFGGVLSTPRQATEVTPAEPAVGRRPAPTPEPTASVLRLQHGGA